MRTVASLKLVEMTDTLTEEFQQAPKGQKKPHYDRIKNQQQVSSLCLSNR